LASTIEPVIGVLDDDLVAEEFCRLCPGVRNQRFLFGQFQLECLTQEFFDSALDLFGFCLRATEAKQPVG
jgi:hypothetical protein